MSDKVCVIKQPAGIGDIFFCQKIAQSVLSGTDCTKVIWPVASTYSYLKDYMIADNVEFVDENSDFDYKNVYNTNSIYMVNNDQFLFVPLQTADYVQKTSKRHNNPLGHGHMKYDFCGVDYDDWKEYFNFSRNEEREDALAEDHPMSPEYRMEEQEDLDESALRDAVRDILAEMSKDN